MLHRTELLTEAQVRGSKATERLSNKKSNNHTHTQKQAHPLTKDGIYKSCTIWASNIHYITHFLNFFNTLNVMLYRSTLGRKWK